MISVPSGVRVWLAVGRTDMRRGMNGSMTVHSRSREALQVLRSWMTSRLVLASRLYQVLRRIAKLDRLRIEQTCRPGRSCWATVRSLF